MEAVSTAAAGDSGLTRSYCKDVRQNRKGTLGRQSNGFELEEPIPQLFEAWPELEELTSKLPSAPPFQLELLPAAVRPMVEDVAARMQVPVDFPAVVAVATLAGVCGRRAKIQPKALDDAWQVVPNLWGAIVAEAGMMKSPVIQAVTAPAQAVEKEWRASWEEKMRIYAQTKKTWTLDHEVRDQQYKKYRRAKQTTEPIQPLALVEPGDEPKVPAQRRLLTTDATLESLHKLLEQNHGGIFVLRDELTGWLTSLEKVGRESERSFYLECWNGDSSFTIDRVGRGSIYVDNCCVSLFGGIQPSRLRSYFADAMRDGEGSDGLIQRFQLLIWPDKSEEWVYKDSKPDAAAFKRAESVYRKITELDAEKPLLLRFSDEAQVFFKDWLTNLMIVDLRNDELNSSLESHFSKYRSLMPSLALLFSLADGCMETVGLEHANQAAAWCVYLMGHAKRVYAAQMKPAYSAALILTRKLQKGLLDHEGRFTVRELCRKGWKELSENEQARAALAVLVDHGWVREVANEDPYGMRKSGRPSDIYEVNPDILKRIKSASSVDNAQRVRGL